MSAFDLATVRFERDGMIYLRATRSFQHRAYSMEGVLCAADELPWLTADQEDKFARSLARKLARYHRWRMLWASIKETFN